MIFNEDPLEVNAVASSKPDLIAFRAALGRLVVPFALSGRPRRIAALDRVPLATLSALA
jgi:hypothetical protein